MSAGELPTSLVDHGFAPSPSPFADVLVLQTRSSNHPAFQDRDARRQFFRRGMSVSTPRPGTLVMSSLRLDEGAPTTLLSGVVMPSSDPNSSSMAGPRQISRSQADAFSGRVGNFTLFRCETERIRAHTDYFGLGALYVYEWPEGALITNRPQLAALCIKAFNLPWDLDDQYMLTLSLGYAFFTWQQFSDRTAITGLKKLGVGQFAEIARGRLKIGGAFDWDGRSDESLDSLLEEARAELTNNARALPDLFPDKRIIVDLSGGRDSRLALAAYLDAGLEFDIRTHDTPPSSDLAISAIIASEFHLNYVREPSGPMFAVAPAVALNMWRSYMMGEYNNLGFATRTNLGDSRHVRVTGGAGGLYRGFWPYALSAFIERNGVATLTDFARAAMFHQSPAVGRLGKDDRDALESLILSSLAELEGLSLKDALYRHYVLYRNRTHFGLRLYSTYNDAYFYMPLLSKGLFAAAQSVSTEVRDSDTIYRRLTSMFNPTLSDMPYDGDSVPRELEISSSDKLNEWREVRQHAVASRESAGDASPKGDRSSSRLIINRALEHALERVAEVAPQRQGLLESVHRVYLDKSERWPREAANLAARILAVEDFLFPLDRGPLPVDGPISINWHDPVVRVEASEVSGGTTVRILLEEGVDRANYEYAFDIKRATARIVQRWYGESEEWFAVGVHGADEVIAFVRPRGTERVFFHASEVSVGTPSQVVPDASAGGSPSRFRRLVNRLRASKVPRDPN